MFDELLKDSSIFLPVNQSDLMVTDENFAKHLNYLEHAQPLLHHLPDNRPKLLITYYYSNRLDVFWVFLATEKNDIIVRKLGFYDGILFQKRHFEHLFHLYKKYFLSITTEEKYLEQEVYEFKQIFLWLHNLFISPISPLITLNSHLLIKMDIEINDKFYLIDLYNIFNMKFRFGINQEREDILVTTITKENIVEFICSLSSLPFPQYSTTKFLYGELGSNISSFFQKIFTLIEKRGGEVHPFNSLEELLPFFRKGGDHSMLQIVAHFHSHRFIFSTNTSGSVKIKDLLRELKKLSNDGLLKKNLVIDGVNCNSFEDFKEFYDVGIKQVFLSHHDLNLKLAIYMLYEFYSCHGAEKIGFKHPYLDGNSYIHEAWANVFKCFCKMMYEEIPIDDIY